MKEGSNSQIIKAKGMTSSSPNEGGGDLNAGLLPGGIYISNKPLSSTGVGIINLQLAAEHSLKAEVQQ